MASSSADPSTSTISDAQLAAIGDVPVSYRHHQRLVTPLAPQAVGGAVLKWAAVALAHAPLTPELEATARALVASELAAGHFDFPYGMGFVVIHHSEELDFVVVASWRAHQEMWISVYTRDAATNDPFTPVERGTHSPVMCAWELAPAWHERDAWVRYLESDRDVPARRAWLEDQLAGLV
jgi:hypothetical protein